MAGFHRGTLLLQGTLVVLFGIVFAWHWQVSPMGLQDILPRTTFDYSVNLSFEGNDQDIEVSVFLPEADDRQYITHDAVGTSDLIFSERQDEFGRRGVWRADRVQGHHQLTYRAEVRGVSLRYEIDPALRLAEVRRSALSADNQQHLQASKEIQSTHSEVAATWHSIAPAGDPSALAALTSIFRFVEQMPTTEFKGVTDALTALRLGQASCNGKSRLFTALTRHIGIPTRLVGGVILDDGSKRTSHQWVETWLNGHWIPFDPTNHYFAELPANYLVLYRGDAYLFRHTSNINFDYEFQIRSQSTLADSNIANAGNANPSGTNDEGQPNPVTQVIHAAGIDGQIAALVLLFPVAALLISFGRNVVGIGSFGVFLPMLLAAACVFMGLTIGLLGFCLVVALGAACHHVLGYTRMLQIPKLATLMTAVTGIVLALALLGNVQFGTDVAALTLLPVVVLSFAAERLHELMEAARWREALKMLAGTLFLTALCFLAFKSQLLGGLIVNFPELLLLVLALQISIGRWSGLKVAEIIRFSRLIRASRENAVLGINERNLNYVQRLNSPAAQALANDKVATKEALSAVGVTVSETLAVAQNVSDLEQILASLQQWQTFVIKPARGRQGIGVLLLRRQGQEILKFGGEVITQEALLHHCREILQGTYAMDGEPDTVLVEALIVPHPALTSLAPKGVPDIRVIVVQGRAIATMMRLPTKHSEGRANLHQGAIGVALDLATGIAGRAQIGGQPVTHHPDSGALIAGQSLPFWSDIITQAERCYKAVPLGYMGVDITIDAQHGPLVIEVNARPGLEIQNVLGIGQRDLLLNHSFAVAPA